MFSLCTTRGTIPVTPDITLRPLTDNEIQNGVIEQNHPNAKNLLLRTYNSPKKHKSWLKSTDETGFKDTKLFNKTPFWKRILNLGIPARHTPQIIAYSKRLPSTPQVDGSTRLNLDLHNVSINHTLRSDRPVTPCTSESGNNHKLCSLPTAIVPTSTSPNTLHDSVEAQSASSIVSEAFKFLPNDISASTTPASSPTAESSVSCPEPLKSTQAVLRYLMEYTDLDELQALTKDLEQEEITPYRFLASLTGTFAENAPNPKGENLKYSRDTYELLTNQLRTLGIPNFIRSAREAFEESAAKREVQSTRL